MSVLMPEDGFPANSEQPLGNIYGRAYTDFIEGIVLREPDTLRHAGNIIESSGFPLASCVEDSAWSLEDAIPEKDSERLAVIIDYSFTDTVRSYVYSGLEVDTKTILFCAQLLGYSKQELRQVVFPSTDFLALLDKREADQQELRVLKSYGRRALIQLGLGTITMKLANRLGIAS